MAPSGQFWRVALTAPTAAAEAFGAALEESSLALTIIQPPRQQECRVEAIFAFVPDPAVLTARLAVAAALYNLSAPVYELTPLTPEDWQRQASIVMPPRHLGRLTVFDAGDPTYAPIRRRDLHIAAATAFGTGEHPTTQLCLRLFQDYLRQRRPTHILDMGCGSGILGLAAARLVPDCTITAVDYDAESVRVTRQNAIANSLRYKLDIVCGKGYSHRTIRRGRPYDLVFANIFARPLMHMAVDLRRHLMPGGMAILSGLLHEQEAMVQSAHRMQRLTLVRKLRMGEWSGLLLARKKIR